MWETIFRGPCTPSQLRRTPLTDTLGTQVINPNICFLSEGEREKERERKGEKERERERERKWSGANARGLIFLCINILKY